MSWCVPWKSYSFPWSFKPWKYEGKKKWQVFGDRRRACFHTLPELEVRLWGWRLSGRYPKFRKALKAADPSLARRTGSVFVFLKAGILREVIRSSTKLWPRSHQNIQRKKLPNSFFMRTFFRGWVWGLRPVFQNLFQFWQMLWWPQWTSTHQPTHEGWMVSDQETVFC